MQPKPELTKENLPALDKWHRRAGSYEEWMVSDTRSDIAGPNNKVRVVNWSNLSEVCKKAGMDEQKMIQAYKEALATGDVIFVEYEEADVRSD